MQKPQNKTWKIGIVGGGPGGLMTAWLLQKIAGEPLHLTILEASGRLGGKILTPRFDSGGAIYEAGAAEFYDYSPIDDDPLKALVREMGLSIQPMGGNSVIMNQRGIGNLDDFQDQAGIPAREKLVEFNRLARDRMSPREFFNCDGSELPPDGSGQSRFDSVLAEIGEGPVRTYLENMMHSDLATEPARTSVNYGLQNYLMNDPAYMQLYSIEGGNERLTAELAARIDALVLLDQRVTRISRAPAGAIRVHSSRDGQPREDIFDFVVLALPHDALQRLEFDGTRLPKAVRDHLEHYNHPAHYLRVTVLFERAFWRDLIHDSWCMLDRFGGCCLYDESSRVPESEQGILGWLLGGAAALEMSGLPDEVLTDRVLDSLPQSMAFGRKYFLESRVHRWVGAVSALPGGVTPRSLDRRHQPEPIGHPNLFLTGDYLFDSTLNGVLDSADYVANWIGALLTDLSPKTGS